MLALASRTHTQSSRDYDQIGIGRRRRAARYADTTDASVYSREATAYWLPEWLADVERLREVVAGTVGEGGQSAGGMASFWESTDAQFQFTPSYHGAHLLEYLRWRLQDPPHPASPAIDRDSDPDDASDRAVAAVQDLQSWLDLTVEQVAELAGTSKSAIHYWRREHATPRPGAARNLYRVHTLVRALRSAIEPEAPLAALSRRPTDGGPSAYELLRTGRYDEAEAALRPLIFRRAEQPIQRPRLIAWDEPEPEAPAAPKLTLRPPVRRARRVSLQQ